VRVWLALLLLSFTAVAQTQKTVIVSDTLQIFSTRLNPYYAFHADPTGRQTIEEVAGAPFHINISSLDSVSKQYRGKAACCWIRIKVKSSVPKTVRMLLFAYFTEGEAVYIFQKGKLILSGDNDTFFSSRPKLERTTFPFNLSPGEEVTLFIRIKNQYNKLFDLGYLKKYDHKGYWLATQTLFNAWIADSFLNLRSFFLKEYSLLAVILFIFFYTVLQYIIHRKKELLWYSAYCLLAFCSFLAKTDATLYIDFPFGYFPQLMAHADHFLWYLSLSLYLRFIQQFADFKTLHHWYYKIVVYLEYFLTGCFFSDLLLVYVVNDHFWSTQIFHASIFALLIPLFSGLYLVFNLKRREIFFLVLANLSLITGGFLTMIFYIKGGRFLYIPFHDQFLFVQIGFVLELLWFSMGLNYKFSLTEQQKIVAQKNLIIQLEDNKVLQHKLNSELEQMVASQTQQIISQREELEMEKERQLQTQFLKKLTEMELQLLKAQLNPHFYFNTLNNLDGLTLLESQKAPEAILKLSDIMEYVIYDCKNDKVALKKEINFLKSYIELEKLRYDEPENISFHAFGNSQDKLISPLLLIQFVENAFKHGLELQKSTSLLQVEIFISGHTLNFSCKNSYSSKPCRSEGIGLNNVKKRLMMLYPEKHNIVFTTREPVYSVELTLELE
jgi:hypothetical protein